MLPWIIGIAATALIAGIITKIVRKNKKQHQN